MQFVVQPDPSELAGLPPVLEALAEQVERVRGRVQRSGLSGSRREVVEWRLGVMITLLRKTRSDLDPAIEEARVQLERDLADEERLAAGE